MKSYKDFEEEELLLSKEYFPYPTNTHLLRNKTENKEEAFIDEILLFSDFLNVHQLVISCLNVLYQIRFGLIYSICFYNRFTTADSYDQSNRWQFNYFLDNSVYRVFTFYEQVGQLLFEHFRLQQLPKSKKDRTITFDNVMKMLINHPNYKENKLVNEIEQRRWDKSNMDLREYRNCLTHRRDPKFEGALNRREGAVTVGYHQKSAYDIDGLKLMGIQSYLACKEIIELIIDELYTE
jgi:hypothetical protein